jgi:diguanylate cyclase (GGDEF)-like protein
MIALDDSWATQQLVEFLALVSSFADERSAVRGAVERAAEALEAEVGAVVRDGGVVASVGFPAAEAHTGELVAAAEETTATLEVPGAGACAAISVALEDSQAGRLLLARGGGDPFSGQEVNLLRGMARVLTLALRGLRVISDERALRQRSEEQARENARLLADLEERQALLERLSSIQRAIVQRTDIAEVLAAVTDGALELLNADGASLRLVDPEDNCSTVLVAARGVEADENTIGSRASAEDGVCGRALKEERLVEEAIATNSDLLLGRGGGGLQAAMAVPVLENGHVVGALLVCARDRRGYTGTERETLLALAEHASIALTDAKNYGTALHRASHDMLTGLPNRALFLDRLEHAKRRNARDERKPAVLFMDLDGFKRVNDTLGHGVGDRLLAAIGERLRECVRPGDTVARFGGDELAILLECVDRPDEAVAVAERVMAELHRPFRIDGKDLSISVSVGIARMRESGEDLLLKADLAMYHAKSKGNGQHVVFDPGMHAALVERRRLEADLERAVQRGEFELFYQPIVELGTGAIVAAEALVRWRHPDRGLLAPGVFIPAAEETGLIRAIGRQVLEDACAQGVLWQKRHPGQAPLAVSVNLSVSQIQTATFVDEVASALERSGLPAGSLILEITETLLMHDLERGALARLKELGVQIAVDDFGTGYSSLQYLHGFPIDILKIAKSFVDGVADPGESALARAIIELGESLDLRVIAEGVEHGHQVTRLVELGCRWAQGFHYARPVPPPELEQVLASTQINGWEHVEPHTSVRLQAAQNGRARANRKSTGGSSRVRAKA